MDETLKSGYEDFTEDDLAALEIFEDKRAITSISKDELIFDKYVFTVIDIETDINSKEVARRTSQINIIVYPFNKRKTTYGYSTDLASYVQDGDTFNCGATSPYGRKSTVIKTDKHCFVINGRWVREQFISYVNTMSDIAENREVSFEKEEFRNKEDTVGHMQMEIKGWDVHIMPLAFENKGVYVPIMLIITNKEKNDTFVCATHSYFSYEGVKIGCRWYEDELVCFEL